MKILVDSDILIEVSRARDQHIAQAWMELAFQGALVLYSPISIAELWCGARPAEHRALEAMFDALMCLPVTAEIGRRAGEYLHRYRKSHGVEVADATIAASAAQTGAMLWTRNRKHFPMKDISFYANPTNSA